MIFSPFTDIHDVVNPKYFVGRQDLFEKFSADLNDSSYNPKFFLITGNKELGKSSFLRYFRHYTENNFRFICCGVNYVDNNEINDMNRIVEQLVADLYYNLSNNSFDSNRDYNEIMEGLSENILKKGWKNDIKFKKSFINNIKDNFAEFLFEVSNKINHKGIFIEIDTVDLENIVSVSKFSKWISKVTLDLKNFDLSIPIVFTVALPKYVINQFFDSSSFFKNDVIIGEVKRLSDDEVKTFLNDGFNRVEWEISDEILDLLVDLSNGHPEIMNSCGSDIYWGCGDSSWVDEAEKEGMRVYGWMTKNIINSKEIVLDALCRHYNDEYFLKLIKLSDNGKIDRVCCSILNKLSDVFKNNFDKDLYFERETIFELLNENEILIFDDYLDRLLNLNVIKFDEKKGYFVLLILLYY